MMNISEDDIQWNMMVSRLATSDQNSARLSERRLVAKGQTRSIGHVQGARSQETPRPWTPTGPPTDTHPQGRPANAMSFSHHLLQLIRLSAEAVKRTSLNVDNVRASIIGASRVQQCSTQRFFIRTA